MPLHCTHSPTVSLHCPCTLLCVRCGQPSGVSFDAASATLRLPLRSQTFPNQPALDAQIALLQEYDTHTRTPRWCSEHVGKVETRWSEILMRVRNAAVLAYVCV